jgi:hypothetical protein
MRIACQPVDIVVQVTQKLTRFCVNVTGLTQFLIQFSQ